jgi:recombinational DNA repair protein RecR
MDSKTKFSRQCEELMKTVPASGHKEATRFAFFYTIFDSIDQIEAALKEMTAITANLLQAAQESNTQSQQMMELVGQMIQPASPEAVPEFAEDPINSPWDSVFNEDDF